MSWPKKIDWERSEKRFTNGSKLLNFFFSIYVRFILLLNVFCFVNLKKKKNYILTDFVRKRITDVKYEKPVKHFCRQREAAETYVTQVHNPRNINKLEKTRVGVTKRKNKKLKNNLMITRRIRPIRPKYLLRNRTISFWARRRRNQTRERPFFRWVGGLPNLLHNIRPVHGCRYVVCEFTMNNPFAVA